MRFFVAQVLWKTEFLSDVLVDLKFNVIVNPIGIEPTTFRLKDGYSA